MDAAPPASGQQLGRRSNEFELRSTALHGAAVSLEQAGQLDDALALHNQALELRQGAPSTPPLALAQSLTHVGHALVALGKLEEALVMQRQALRAFRRVQGDTAFKDVAACLSDVAATLGALSRHEEALQCDLHALEVLRLGELDADVATAMNNIGATLAELGRFPEALAHLEAALAASRVALGPGHPQVATSLNNLGITLGRAGRLDDALDRQLQALVIFEAARGAAPLDHLAALSNAGRTLRQLGRLPEALERERQALALCAETLPPEHPTVASCLHSLGVTLGRAGEHGEALAVHARALALHERLGAAMAGSPGAQGAIDLALAESLDHVVDALLALDRHAEALAKQQQALELTKTARGASHPLVAERLNSVAATLAALGRHAEALRCEEQALAIFKAELGGDHAHVAASLLRVAATMNELGRFRSALERQREALSMLEAAQGPRQRGAASALMGIASTFSRMGLHEEALRHLLQALEVLEELFGESVELVPTLDRIAATLAQIGKTGDAQIYRDRALRARSELPHPPPPRALPHFGPPPVARAPPDGAPPSSVQAQVGTSTESSPDEQGTQSATVSTSRTSGATVAHIDAPSGGVATYPVGALDHGGDVARTTLAAVAPSTPTSAGGASASDAAARAPQSKPSYSSPTPHSSTRTPSALLLATITSDAMTEASALPTPGVNMSLMLSRMDEGEIMSALSAFSSWGRDRVDRRRLSGSSAPLTPALAHRRASMLRPGWAHSTPEEDFDVELAGYDDLALSQRLPAPVSAAAGVVPAGIDALRADDSGLSGDWGGASEGAAFERPPAHEGALRTPEAAQSSHLDDPQATAAAAAATGPDLLDATPAAVRSEPAGSAAPQRDTQTAVAAAAAAPTVARPEGTAPAAASGTNRAASSDWEPFEPMSSSLSDERSGGWVRDAPGWHELPRAAASQSITQALWESDPRGAESDPREAESDPHEAESDPREAETDQREAEDVRERMEEAVASLNSVAETLRRLRRREEALARERQAVALARDVGGGAALQLLAACANNVGATLRDMGRHGEALTSHEEALAALREALDAPPPSTPRETTTLATDVALTMTHIGFALNAQRRFGDALNVQKQALAICQAAPSGIGPLHIASLLCGAAHSLAELGRHGEAHMCYSISAKRLRRAVGGRHPLVGVALGNVGASLAALERYDDATAPLQQALAILRAGLDAHDVHVERAAVALGHVLTKLGRWEEAAQLFAEAVDAARARRTRGDRVAFNDGALAGAAIALWELRRVDAALEAMQQLLEARREALPARHADVATACNYVACALSAAGRYAEALPFASEAVAIRVDALGERHPDVATALNNVAFVHARLGDRAAALGCLRRALSTRCAAFGAASQSRGVDAATAAPLEREERRWDGMNVAALSNNFGCVLADAGRANNAATFQSVAAVLHGAAAQGDEEAMRAAVADVEGALAALDRDLELAATKATTAPAAPSGL